MKDVGKKRAFIENSALVAMIAAGVSILTLVILHATKVTDISSDLLTQILLLIACIIFVLALPLFVVLRVLAVRAARKKALEELAEKPVEEPVVIVEEEVLEASAPTVKIIAQEFDKSFTLDKICENFAAYSAENGLALSSECAKNLIAALGSSRLIAVADADEATVSKLSEILSGYFGGASAQPLKEVLHSAYQNPDSVAIANIRGDVRAISALAVHAFNPERGVKVTLGDGYATLSYTIPSNLWAVAHISLISPSAADAVAFVCFEAGSAVSGGEAREVGYNQFIKSVGLGLDTSAPDEDKFWKKYDKIEKFVKDNSGYSADNKKRRAVEAFASAYLACGGENALDCTSAAHLAAPSRIAADNLVRAAEGIFGEDSAAALRKIADAVEKLWQN